MSEEAFEVNFDGIVGPSHNYAGLSFGNIASIKNQASLSHPRSAALQGLEKMKFLAELGVRQAVLPPHERPHLPTLKRLGLNDVETAFREAPEIFINCCSGAAMWTANAATVAPSADTVDGKVHITPANLSSKFHRSIEHPTTERVLKKIFADESRFTVHPVLLEGQFFADEGAANHTRFCDRFNSPGVQLFVYGKVSFKKGKKTEPSRYPARQTLAASRAISRLHQLNKAQVVFAQQNPEAIDQGVFHNDVISVGNQNIFFYHEKSFLDTEQTIIELANAFEKRSGKEFKRIMVPEYKIPLETAVSTYLFNSQIVTLPGGGMNLIAPLESYENKETYQLIQEILNDPSNPIIEAHYFNLRESMRNGGGPACLRLRVVLTESELQKIHQGIFFTPHLYTTLRSWVEKYYPEELVPSDLSDPTLIKSFQEALDELTKILNIGSIYSFQQ